MLLKLSLLETQSQSFLSSTCKNLHFEQRLWNLRFRSIFVRALADGSPYRTIGSSSNDDGDGSENVTIKTNSRFFKRRRDYSNSL